MTSFVSIHKFLNVLILIITGLLLLLIPQWIDERLMFPTQSGKFFLFAAGIFLLFGLLGLSNLLSGKLRTSVTTIDILLILLIVYQVTRVKYFSGIEFYEFNRLVLFYIIIRTISPEKTKYLLLFTILDGAIRAIYGNLQLYGIFGSNHSLFKMTGSFFSPGPYAGYLVSVLPVSLFCYSYVSFDKC